jgi:hypothetical protein
MRLTFFRIALFFLTPAVLCGMGSSQAKETSFGILSSTDNGKNWKQVFRGDVIVDHLAIDGQGRIIASSMIVTPKIIGSEIYISGPAPEQWRKVSLPGIDTHDSLIYDLLTDTDGSVLALLKGKILRTDDGGVKWTVVASALPASFISFMPGPDSSLLASPSQGIYQSRDKGKNWQSLGFDDQKISSKTALRNSSVLLSLNCRLLVYSIAQERSSELFIPEESCPGYEEFAADSKGSLFANTSHGILKSDAVGKHWEKVLSFREEVSPSGIGAAPNGNLFALILIGTSRITLFRSGDAGMTWEAVRKLGAGVNISQFAYSPDGTIYAGLTSFGD